MKIIQVLDEVSKKNFSIASIVKIIDNYEFLKTESKILVSTKNEKNYKANITKDKFKNIFYFSEISKIIKKNNPDIVHIHGLWRPIHFYFILHSLFQNIPLIVQPHGMLLDEALKSKSVLSYFLKLMTLFIFYKFFLSKSSFIAVTEEEKKSIKKYFPKSNVSVVRNPFETYDRLENNIKKRFIYFGRYNKHKNLKEFLEAFIEAKPSSDWSLEIYGIDDDKSYKEQLIDLVKRKKFQNYIKFYKPEFDKKKKFKIISSSWCNVLLSKSEILSLSVLEAFSVGTQSLVNKKIFFPPWIKHKLISTSLEKDFLIKKIKHVMSQDINDKRLIKSKMIKLFDEKYEIGKEKKNYKYFLENIIKSHKKIFKISNSFYFLFSNLLNSAFIPFLLIFQVLLNNSELGAEIGVFPGIVLLLTQVFSANARSLFLYNDKREFYIKTINTRLLVGLLITGAVIFYHYFFYQTENFTLLTIISFIVYLSWVNEMNLSLHEKNNSVLMIKIFFFINFIFYFVLALGLVLSPDIPLKIMFLNLLELKIFLLAYLVLHFLFIIYHFDYVRTGVNRIKKFNFEVFKLERSLMSSFFSILSVIIWRISLISLTGKSNAGIFFAAFAIASFPGTLFNNIAGQILIMNKKIRNFFSEYSSYFSFGYLSFLMITFYLNRNFFHEISLYKFFDTTLISLLGTYFMLISLYDRHIYLSMGKSFQQKIFIRDIIYSISIMPIIGVLFIFGGNEYLVLSYLLSSIFALFFYKIFKL